MRQTAAQPVMYNAMSTQTALAQGVAAAAASVVAAKGATPQAGCSREVHICCTSFGRAAQAQGCVPCTVPALYCEAACTCCDTNTKHAIGDSSRARHQGPERQPCKAGAAVAGCPGGSTASSIAEATTLTTLSKFTCRGCTRAGAPGSISVRVECAVLVPCM